MTNEVASLGFPIGFRLRMEPMPTHSRPALKNKNPLHPSALRAGDLKVNRTVVVFNVVTGIIGEYRILSRIFNDARNGFSVRLREVKTGRGLTVPLWHLGVVSRYGEWSETFTVDHRKSALLPEPEESRVVRFNPWTQHFFGPESVNSLVHLAIGQKNFGKTSLNAKFIQKLLEENPGALTSYK